MNEVKFLDIDGAVDFLREKGLKISKSSLYKNTMNKTIPFRRFGKRKLVFTEEELNYWATDQIKTPTNLVFNSVRKSALNK